MRASLADQADAVAAQLQRPGTLAIALGANVPSTAGHPAETLLAVRPLLEQTLLGWVGGGHGLRLCWSPLIQTAPVGGPAGQSDYVNGALLVELPEGPLNPVPSAPAALRLLQQLQQLESQFGRPPLAERVHWGPRSLDLDWLWWGALELDLPATAETPALQLPHPLWCEREFVLAPLRAIAGLTAGFTSGVTTAD